VCQSIRKKVSAGSRICARPRDRDKIDWKLITDLPINSRTKAIEKLNWYAVRWKIETYHKILKSGCKAEDSKLRTAERLVNLIAMFCILSWRIFWLTMMNRAAPNASPRMALTKLEIQLLDKLIADNRSQNSHRSLSSYLVRLARLGGYLARATDPPPGNTVMWRGMSRLTDIEIGFQLGAQHVGNCKDAGVLTLSSHLKSIDMFRLEQMNLLK